MDAGTLLSLAEVVRVQAPFPRMAIVSMLLLCCSSCGWPLAPPVKLPLAPAARLEVHKVTAPNGPIGTVSLDQPPIITAADVLSVGPDDSSGTSNSIIVELTPAGGAKMAAATTPATGQQVAIVLKGKIIGMPAIHAALSDRFIISVWTQAAERDAVLDSLTR